MKNIIETNEIDYIFQKQKMIIGSDKELTVNKLCAVFFDSSSSEKYFWLISILQICIKTKIKEIDISELYDRMIANAWHLVLNHNLSLGYKDPINKSIVSLQKNMTVPIESSLEELLKCVAKGKEGKRNPIYIVYDLPYSFLSPWFDGLCSSSIKEKIQNRESGCLYSIYEKWHSPSYIVINDRWRDFIFDNFWILINFAYEGLANYLKYKNRQTHNLMSLLRVEGGYTSDMIKKRITNPSLCYYFNDKNKCYVFNSLLKEIYSGAGCFLVFNNTIYKLSIGSFYLFFSILKEVKFNQVELSKPLIKINDGSPLYALYEKKMFISKIQDIRHNTVKQIYEIQVDGVWYDNRGYLSAEKVLNTSFQKKKVVEIENIKEGHKDLDKPHINRRRTIIGKYVKLYPSHLVGMVTAIKFDEYNNQKLVVKILNGKIIEMYDNPLLYKTLSQNIVNKINQ